MARPITLFTGQWADLPLERVCELAATWGFDGLELASWGDHLDVARAAADDAYVAERKAVLADHGLQLFAISNHLVGQAVCDDPIDERHRAILPERVWGDGDAEGVRQRAGQEMMLTAQAARKLGVDVVTGFTGSSIWPLVAMFPPVSASQIARGFGDFAGRWTPILDAFDEVGVRFALEVHPGEIAYDYWTTARALEAIDRHPSFGVNFDPSHLIWQDVDPVSFLWDFRDRVFHVHVKDTKRRLDGRGGRLGSHLPWGDPRRGWDFVSPGHGDVPWEQCVRMLNAIGYEGPLSIEWEDAGMERETGAAEARAFVAGLASIRPAGASFDAAFSNSPTSGI
ncbi:MAG TPA: sugar phosphate isomerase/epimerase family protein [Solirubrobacteraceae bacterium]|jgi:sugar phosphate isomerase/epimerase